MQPLQAARRARTKPARQDELQARVWKQKRLDSSRKNEHHIRHVEKERYQARTWSPFFQQHPGQPRKAILKAFPSSCLPRLWPAGPRRARACWQRLRQAHEVRLQGQSDAMLLRGRARTCPPRSRPAAPRPARVCQRSPAARTPARPCGARPGVGTALAAPRRPAGGAGSTRTHPQGTTARAAAARPHGTRTAALRVLHPPAVNRACVCPQPKPNSIRQRAQYYIHHSDHVDKVDT